MMKLLIYISVLLFVISSCKNKNIEEEKSNNLINVKIAEAQMAKIKLPINCSGRLSTKSESKLSFKIGGIIDKIYVNEGETVRSGQILAQLNLSEIQAKVDQANLAFEKAKRDYDRIENLYKDSVATLEQFQDVTTQLELAKANLKISNFNLRYSTIIAPSKGKILMKLASANEVIGAGYPVMLFGSTEEQWVVKTNLSDQQVVQIQLLDTAYIYFDAYPNQMFMARVSEIASAADLYTGTYNVELKLDQNEFLLKTGFIAKITLIPAKKKAGILIPVDALMDLNNLSGNVYQIKNGTPIKKEVQISEIMDSLFLIGGGILDGDTVITDGMHYIDENSVVNIIN